MTTTELEDFQQIVWRYFADFGRDLPWRIVVPNAETFAYYVLVSEFMLQQTQVNRVIEKYQQWIEIYPSISDVARASLADVLTSWSGLGYNRRAKFLHETCKIIVSDYQGVVPASQESLKDFPGIGYNTAAAIAAYAYNQPTVFIETNIRTVFIHHFFQEREYVTDAELLPLITNALNGEPREWYWALMDYGTFLKKQVGNASWRSKHYVKQSSFEGSKRQLRGLIIKKLILGPTELQELEEICHGDKRLSVVLEDLVQEKLIIKTGVNYLLVGS